MKKHKKHENLINSFSNYKDKIIYFAGSGSNKFDDISDNVNFKFLPDIIPNSIHMGELSYNKFLNNDFEELSTFEPNYIKISILLEPSIKATRSPVWNAPTLPVIGISHVPVVTALDVVVIGEPCCVYIASLSI